MMRTPNSGRGAAWPRPLRTFLILLLAVAVSVGLVWSANSLAKSGRKPAKPSPRAEIAKKSQSPQRFDISPEAIQQIAALEAEKESRNTIERKIDSQLLQAVREARGAQMTAGVQLDPANVDADDAGTLAVDIAADVNDDLLSKIEALGGEIVYPSWQYHTIRARVNLSVIETIAGYSEVRFIEPAVRYLTQQQNIAGNTLITPAQNLLSVASTRSSFAERAARVRGQLRNYFGKSGNGNIGVAGLFPRVPTGTVNSEGDRTHRADDTRNTYGYQGAGIRIGVLSDSFDNRGGAAADIASGNLPGPGNPLGNTTPVTVLQDQSSGGNDEGRAMLQIVHDLAPKAQLFFATAGGGTASFAANIQALRNAPNSCDIIIDDVIYLSESPFQDGIIAQAVDTVTASGALYFSAAGNGGSLAKNTSGVFEGDFNDAGSAPFSGTSKPGTIHNFGTVSAPVNGDIITAAGRYVLYWADPAGASNNDYDLFLVDSTGTVKASSTNIQNGTQNPFEQIIPSSALATGDRVVVFKSTAAAARAFHLDSFGGRLTVATTGATHGHACAANAFGVSAARVTPYPNPFSSSNLVETFTSDGPRQVFFNANGTAITPGNFLFASNGGAVRNKPDVTAADGVSTTLPSNSGLNPFLGTSAAAPHAGAIAALIKSANPSLTPAQVRTILTTTTVDIEASGYDTISGYGILQAFQAMQAVNPTATANVNLGTVSVTEQGGNGNGAIEPGESGNIVVQLNNSSLVAATNVNATLTTSTSGITITQASASYGTIAPGGNATNSATPFIFTVASNVTCGTVITFSLTVSFGGGASPQAFLVTQNVGSPPGFNISSTLGQTPPTATGYTSTSGQQTGRLNRNGVASSCATPKTAPGLTATTGSRQYDAYTFTNASSTSQCVTVTLTAGNGTFLYTAAYNNSGFAPANPNTNFLADAGVSATTTSYSFTVPPNQPFTVVVHDINVTPASQSPYTLSVTASVCPGASATPTPTPTPGPPPTLPALFGASKSGQLFALNLSTGAGTLIGNIPVVGGTTEIVFNNTTRRAFAQFSDGGFAGQEFNINTGAAIGGPISNAGSYDGLEWVGSTLYGTAIFGPGGPSQLRTLNPFAGTSTLIGATGIGPIDGLAYEQTTGIMYGTTGGSKGASSLVTVNLTTGVATTIGSVGFNAGSLEFGPDGNLYAGSVGGTGNLYRIDKSTGASTLIGATGFINVTGLTLVTAAAPTPTPTPTPTPGTTDKIVISQVYGGGGTTGATYQNNFLEIFNRGNNTVNLNGYTFEFASSPSGSFDFGISFTSVNGIFIQPGQHFLLQLGTSGTNGAVLPVSPDFSINPPPPAPQVILGASGKIAIAKPGTGLISGACPLPNSNIVDFVGYGTATNCFEGSPVATLTNTTAALRKFGGCVDTDNNSSDFSVGSPTPRNSSSPISVCSNPLDDATFFVRQHYLDFLNRQPDDAGLAFWTGQITSCGTNQACIDDKRNNVSASFFLSIEFQQTGYLVERMYKAAYGDATGSSLIGGAHQLPVPIVRFNEFLPDTQRIGQGVIVGQPGWETVLETNKQAFASEFVQRSRFSTAYATTLTPTQFVDQLFAKAGVTPSATDRNAAIAEFGSATNTSDVAARGRALRRVAENSTLVANEFNRAFVLMQYFGYLRRNPDDAPEATRDHSGYDFWLTKLNFFNGNYIQAEMVKAFITSIEYRQRFGP